MRAGTVWIIAIFVRADITARERQDQNIENEANEDGKTDVNKKLQVRRPSDANRNESQQWGQVPQARFASIVQPTPTCRQGR